MLNPSLRFCFPAASLGLLVALLLIPSRGRAQAPNPSTPAPAPVVATERSVTDAERTFVLSVLPLFEEKCFTCHGNDPEDIRGEYDMLKRESLLAGGESGEPAVVVADAAHSPLYQAICWDGLEMPPKANDRLSAQQCQLVADWINAGAPWPNAAVIADIQATAQAQWDASDGVMVSTSGGLSAQWTRRRYAPADLWAYQAIPTQVEWDQVGSALSLDTFIERKLESEDIPAAPMADRETLIRRATYDLLGLPPTQAEVAAFVGDPRDEETAFAEVVDRLLASPHYGEQWGRHWLDVVRYADSSGFANDYHRGNAWRYRDYVVRSFNNDKPFNQFVREQVAGDELDPSDPEMLVAVGFLRMGPWELTGMEVAKVARQRFLDDVTNSVGETFLAHSLQCARCHDHKFDPVPTQDYYAIQACFATTQLAERQAAFLPAENLQRFDQRRYLIELRDQHQTTLRKLDALQLEAAELWYHENKIDPQAWHEAVEQATRNAGDDSQAAIFKPARNILQRRGIAEAEIPPKGVGFSPQEFGLERVARKGIERLRWELEAFQPYALSVYVGGTPDRKSVYAPLRVPNNPLQDGRLEQSTILIGGDPFTTGAAVEPAALSVLEERVPFTIPSAPEGRRLALADWIVDEANPLTPRVIVNRIWMWHFGTALAGNPNNFGATGKKPTHPQLLDWLSRQFLADGWSIKAMHRRIMLSRAYRRTSNLQSIPTEQHESAVANYAAFQPRRLTAEELRDSMLAVSGELNRTLGGIPNRPEINHEVAMQPRMVMGTFARAWVPDPLPADRHRRSLYALTLRGLRDPAMEVFNQPAPDFSCEARDESMVTPQVFSLFNSQASYARAIALASRVLVAHPSSSEQANREAVSTLFAFAVAREPTSDELELCLAHWQAMTARHESLTFSKADIPLTIQRDAVEENTGERFRFTETLPAYRDFIPDPGLADVSARTRGLAEVALALLNSHEFSYVY